jgi:hypothetical protein
MSHPNPSHDKGHEYPEDKVTHYPKKTFGLSHLLTTNHTASVKAGKRNAAISKALMKKKK